MDDIVEVEVNAGEGKSGEMDFMRKVRTRHNEAETGWRENYALGLDDIKHLNGEQWPQDILEERKGRPCLTINRLPGFVDQVVGDQRQNRPRIKVTPVDNKGDADIAEIMSGLIRNIENVSSADFAYDTALEHSVGSGIGYIRVLKDYAGDDTFDQDVSIKRVRNQFSILPDPQSSEPDGSDMRYCFAFDVISKDEFKARFPNAATLSGDEITTHQGMGYENWFLGDNIKIAEYWERKEVRKPIVQLSDGRVMDKVDTMPERLLAEGATIIRERMAVSYEVNQYIVNGHEILEGPKRWDGKYIPIVPVYGKELVVDGKRVLRGLVRFAKDSQRAYNYWRSIITETIALQPRAPYIMTANQVAGYEEIWRNANKKSYAYLPYNSTGEPLPQRNFPAPIPGGAFAEAQVAIDDMKATTGIYDASLGAKSNETSGKAIMVRQKEGDTATFVYIDNLTRAMQQVGRIIVDLIPKVYDTERIVRIINPDNVEANLPINKVGIVDGMEVIINDLTVGKYDVVIETGPSYTTQRQEAAEGTLRFMQTLPAQAQLMADIAAKNMDWPDADKISKRLKRAIPPHLLGPDEIDKDMQEPPPNPQMEAEQTKMQLEMEKLKLEEQKMQTDVMIEQEKIKIEIQKMELEKFKIEADVEKERIKSSAKINY